MLSLFGSQPLVLVAPSPELSPAILGHRIDPRNARYVPSLLIAAIVRPLRSQWQMPRETKSFDAACAFATFVVSVGSAVEANSLDATELSVKRSKQNSRW